MKRAIVCSFSGHLADLPKGQRTEAQALRVLSKHPRVSVWDMSETPWLCSLVQDMERAGLIEQDLAEPYPWCKFNLTDAGRAAIQQSKGEA